MADETITAAASRSEAIRQIAQTLIERRKARGLTLDKISQTLKIRLPYLEALEKGDWDNILGEVYVRGFIKRYAIYLGIDAERLLAPYVNLNPSAEDSSKAPVKKQGVASDFSKNQIVWVGVGGLLLIGFFNLIRQEKNAPLKTPTAPAVVHSTQAVAAVAPVKVETPKPVLAAHRIEVFAPFSLWLRVNAQDRNFEGFIPEGATWTWKASGQFTIRMGHTQGVALLFDGQPVALADNQKKIVLPANEN